MTTRKDSSIAEAKRRTKETYDTSKETRPVAPGPGRGNKKKGLSDKPFSKGGTDPEYLAGRIKAKATKDPMAAEVAAKVERGEYASMRAAARDAGVLKPVDPVKSIAAALAKLPRERLAELVDRAHPDARRLTRRIDLAGTV